MRRKDGLMTDILNENLAEHEMFLIFVSNIQIVLLGLRGDFLFYSEKVYGKLGL